MNKWDQRFLDLAALVATWSKDNSTQVGSVIVDKRNRVVSLGFNGFPHGVQDMDDIPFERDEKLRRTIHGEMNALYFAKQSVEGCRIYVTHHPCAHCTAGLIQAGITTIYYANELSSNWRDQVEASISMCNEAGVTLIKKEETI